ncbi:MAG: TetR/AcrR family transcriptional regulator [Actinobacteria bacterium]|nr:TetR/AcrR family transcriptional regulator [Actinomycetota bacterium]
MSSGHPTRAERRDLSESAILDAATELYAVLGPDGVSLRQLAAAAGLTHAMVSRYYGSKQGLVSSVEGRLLDELRTITDGIELTSATGLVDLLTALRRRPVLVALLVRSGLGDLDGTTVPTLIAERCATNPDGDRRSRLTAYGAASLVLGWLSWDAFLEPAIRLGRVSGRRRDAAAAAAAAAVVHATMPLQPRQITGVDGVVDAAATDSPRAKLLAAAVELFSEQGPASVSIRDIARHAGVNHGLIHRHFGSKDDLLAEAIEVGSFSLQPGAFDPAGFDIDRVVHAMHHGSPSPKTIARVIVDDIAIGTVRPRYPVLERLLIFTRQLPPEARPLELADPRLAAAAAVSLVVGSAIWGATLRVAFGLEDDDGIESAMADLGRWLLGAPSPSPSVSTG